MLRLFWGLSLPILLNAYTLGFISYNDVFFDTDKEYTGAHGLYFADRAYTLGYQIDVYTPPKANHNALTPPAGVHPYSGFGYLFGAYHLNDPLFEYIYTLKLGFTGDASNAQRLQDGIHTLTRNAYLQGWDSQIAQRFITQAGATLIYPIYFQYVELSPSLSIDIGNLYWQEQVDLKASYQFEYLLIFSQFGVTHTFYNALMSGFEGYAYGVTPTAFRVEAQYGITIYLGNFYIDFANIFQSARYTTANSGHNYTKIVLNYSFN